MMEAEGVTVAKVLEKSGGGEPNWFLMGFFLLDCYLKIEGF